MEQVEGCYGCRMLARRAADAQATIAALQARVKELEEWKHIVTGAGTDQESVIRLAAYEYTKIAVQCWKEANARLESQLTQRTAELEAAKRDRDELQSVFDLGHTRTVEADKLWQDAHGKPEVWPDLGDLVGWLIKRHDDVQAELERVRADNKALDKWRADVTVSLQRPEGAFFVDVPQHIKDLVKERDELRTLVLALPKVEGEIEVSSGVYNFILLKHDSGTRFLCGQIETEHTARAIAALWQHRQGMEGSHE